MSCPPSATPGKPGGVERLSCASCSEVEGFDITSLSKDKQRLLKPLLPELARHSGDDFYRFHIEATLQMLKQVAGATDKGCT
jgi:hypothetical protein